MQDIIVPVYKAILLLTNNAFLSVANQIGFGFRCGFELIANYFMKQNVYVLAMLVYWVQISWDNGFVEIYSLQKELIVKLLIW